MAVQVSKRNGKFFGSTAKGEHHTDKLVASVSPYIFINESNIKDENMFFGRDEKVRHHTDKLVASSRIYNPNHNEISRNDLTTCHL